MFAEFWETRRPANARLSSSPAATTALEIPSPALRDAGNLSKRKVAKQAVSAYHGHMPYVLQPPDFKIVQAVVLSLIEADWFDRTSENEKACTQLVLVTYDKGGMTREDLYGGCVDTAREIFGKPQAARFVPSSVTRRH